MALRDCRCTAPLPIRVGWQGLQLLLLPAKYQCCVVMADLDAHLLAFCRPDLCSSGVYFNPCEEMPIWMGMSQPLVDPSRLISAARGCSCCCCCCKQSAGDLRKQRKEAADAAKEAEAALDDAAEDEGQDGEGAAAAGSSKAAANRNKKRKLAPAGVNRL